MKQDVCSVREISIQSSEALPGYSTNNPMCLAIPRSPRKLAGMSLALFKSLVAITCILPCKFADLKLAFLKLLCATATKNHSLWTTNAEQGLRER